MLNKEKKAQSERFTVDLAKSELVRVKCRRQLKVPCVFRHFCFAGCDAGPYQAPINAEPLLHRRRRGPRQLQTTSRHAQDDSRVA